MQLDEVNIEGRPLRVVVWECACVWPDNHAAVQQPCCVAVEFFLPLSVSQSTMSSSPRRSQPSEDTPAPRGENSGALGENSGALRELIKETVQELLSERTPDPTSASHTQTGER